MSKGLKYSDLKKLGHNAQVLLNKAVKLGFDADENQTTLAQVVVNLNLHDRQRYPMLGLFLTGPSNFSEPKNLITHSYSHHGKVVELIGLKNAAN